ncbi:hypothetical protein CcaCcLH18_01098 [Colletotrichum camelliae]|nr:hypothetical protein CcaCcLH18_01098 [Colletotrichum camelliae]
MILFKQHRSPTMQSPGNSTPKDSCAEFELCREFWERLLMLNVDLEPEVWRPKRNGDDIDGEERDIARYLAKVMGENNGDYCRYEMLPKRTPYSITKNWEEIQSLLEYAEDEDLAGTSPFSEEEPTEVLRLLQRFTAWASPNLRFDRYVLKRERNDEPFYTIRVYLRDILVLLSMKSLWEDNLRLEWQPDIHPVAIHRAVAFASKIGQRATTELFGAFLERMECTSLDSDSHFFPQSPTARQDMTRRFLSGLPKCKPMQNSDIAHPVATYSTSGMNHHTKGVRFILPEEDPRKETKLSPLRELTKQYKLSAHTFVRLSIFIYSDSN